MSEPTRADIIQHIDPDWRDHFITLDEAYEFYSLNQYLIEEAIKELSK